MKRSWRALALLGAAGLLPSCASTPRPGIDIGMARVGLSQAFTDKNLTPLPPQVIVRLVPAPPQVLARPDLRPYVVQPGAPPAARPVAPRVPTCPAAPKDAAVPAAAPLSISGPPQPGYYKFHNEGTIKITSGSLTLQFPYPAHTYAQVSDVQQVETSATPTLTSTPRTQFTLTTTVTPTYVVTETYQFDPSKMDLVHHEETNDGAVISDDWVPPVEVFDESGIGKTWQDIAASTPTKRTFTIDGTTIGKRVVDVCGSLIETVEAHTQTTIIDAATQQTSGTTSGMTDVEAIATSAGGLAAYREIHTTNMLSVNGSPVTIQIDVASTIDNVVPLKGRPS
jgi:hypothetical protein